MASTKAVEPQSLPRSRPHEIERSGERLDNTITPEAAARQAVEALLANGAELNYRPAAGDLLPSFTYALGAGGDRQRCRTIIVEAKGRPLVWAAVLKEIASRSGGAA